jgi:hypothetical protein
VNPYKIIKNWQGYEVDIYDPRVMKLYQLHANDNKQYPNLPPHVFEVAQSAYSALTKEGTGIYVSLIIFYHSFLSGFKYINLPYSIALILILIYRRLPISGHKW